MGATKQEKADFRAGNKALKVEIKIAKKAISRAKKTIKKEQKLIGKTRILIGRQYYQDHIRQPANNQEKYARWCGKIASAEEKIQSASSAQDSMTLRLQTVRLELKQRKQALRAGPVPDVEII